MRVLKNVYYKASGHASNAINVSIGYEEGGYNYFTGAKGRRGYYAYAYPCNVNRRDGGFSSISQSMFEGAKHFLQEATRFSQKTAGTFNLEMPEVKELIRFVLNEYNMEIEIGDDGNYIIC